MRRFGLTLAVSLALASLAPAARAGPPGAQPSPAPPGAPAPASESPAADQAPPLAAELPPDANIDFATTPPEGKLHDDRAEDLTRPPPMRPRPQGLVLEATLGALGFVGKFRHVSPPGYWGRVQLGYEVLRWLMLYGEAELAFTDTSVSQDPSASRVVPIFGFGGGLRATMHATERVAFTLQGEVGAVEADVPHDALAILGYRNAESLNVSVGARLGVEWYQVDRHVAIFASVGGRDATGFARTLASDFPVMWDAGGGFRYTF